jgi:hypothetical protein
LFQHCPAILCVIVDSEDSIVVNKYNIFDLLAQAVGDDSLLKEAVNEIPFIFMEKDGVQQPISMVYRYLTSFVTKHKELSQFRELFNDKNYFAFRESLDNDQAKLALLKQLINHEIFQQRAKLFVWVDSSNFNGYGKKEKNRQVNPLTYKQIPNYNNLNAMIVHSSTSIGGHYVCYVKKNSSWYLCNDSTVSKVDDIEVSIKNGGTGPIFV